MAMSARDQAGQHCEQMRQEGLRPVVFWLPDVTSPEFAAEAHRQSLLAANSPHAKEDMDFLEAISWLNTEEANSSWVGQDLE